MKTGSSAQQSTRSRKAQRQECPQRGPSNPAHLGPALYHLPRTRDEWDRAGFGSKSPLGACGAEAAQILHEPARAASTTFAAVNQLHLLEPVLASACRRAAAPVSPPVCSFSGSCGSCGDSSSSRPCSDIEGEGEWQGSQWQSGSSEAGADVTARSLKRRARSQGTGSGRQVADQGPGPPQDWAEGEGEVCVGTSQLRERRVSHHLARTSEKHSSRRPSSHLSPRGTARTRDRPHKAGSSTGQGPRCTQGERASPGARSLSPDPGLVPGGSQASPSATAAEAGFPAAPIHRLSKDTLLLIFQKLSTSEWRTLVPLVCKRWRAAVASSDQLWRHVEVCPFENSEVLRRLTAAHLERYWPMASAPGRWLASSSLSRQRVLSSVMPHAHRVQVLLLSCLSLTLKPSPVAAAPEEPPRLIRASNLTEADLVTMLRGMRGSLRQFLIRVSGEITTPRVMSQVCCARGLELLHAELGNVELNCSMIAPLKSLTSLRLRRDDLSLDANRGGMRLVGLHRLEACQELRRLNIGMDNSLRELPAQLFRLSKLRSLEVERCSSMERLPGGISLLGGLETLSLTGSSSLAALPAAIGALSRLVSLNLDFCTQMAALPREISGLTSLRMLSMEGGYSMEDDSVPEEIGMCASLESLVLADTHILSLPRLGRKLSTCINLRVLYLDHNDDLQVESYPEELLALPRLTTFSMRKYERHSWSVISTRNIARMQEEATQFRLQRGRMLQISL